MINNKQGKPKEVSEPSETKASNIKDLRNDNPPDKNCMSCEWRIQGEGCCFCANPKQKIKAYKTYVYWCFDCDLHSLGRMTEKKANDLGYVKRQKTINLANGDKHKLYYYEKC